MKKSVLFLFLAISVSVNAQNSMWWGYIAESEITDPTYGQFGYSSASTIDVAIYVPANDAFVGGSTITSVRLWLGTDISKMTGDLKIWIARSSLPTNINNADYLQSVAVNNLSVGMNQITLTTPFAVNNGAIYVGYTITTNSRAYPIVSGGSPMPNSFYYRNSSEMSWIDFYAYDYDKLALQLRIEGGTYPENVVTAYDFGKNVVMQGEWINVPLTIKNGGKNNVSSISYTVTTSGGTTTAEQTLSFNPIGLNATTALYISLEADQTATIKDKTVTITKVNGVPNNATQPDAFGKLVAVSSKPAVKPVVEEFTGTWCGWCPNGIVGMQKASQTYGNTVVLIAAHNGDPMELAEYSPVVYSYASGFPHAVIDMTIPLYPNASELNNGIAEAFTKTTQAFIQLSAHWTSDTKEEIAFSSTTEFFYDDDNGQYAVAYVLVEDGLTGNGSNWAQTNYLSGSSGDPNMTFWYNSPSLVSGMTYNLVPVAAWEPLNGIDGSISPVIRTNTPQTHSCTQSITGNTLIQSKNNLTAVALLIDRFNGRIVNADQVLVQDHSTALNNITMDDATPVQWYSVDGKELGAPRQGLNIVTFSDGTTRKIIIQ